jgi:hypothetical protein
MKPVAGPFGPALRHECNDLAGIGACLQPSRKPEQESADERLHRRACAAYGGYHDGRPDH